jgi:hypothetical protein
MTADPALLREKLEAARAELWEKLAEALETNWLLRLAAIEAILPSVIAADRVARGREYQKHTELERQRVEEERRAEGQWRKGTDLQW